MRLNTTPESPKDKKLSFYLPPQAEAALSPTPRMITCHVIPHLRTSFWRKTPAGSEPSHK
ncbi:MAG: hypothetical protein HOI17_03980 [Alphaproteobacteria bacterium]|nr:hypothetical protein [Alphaproteobacteria bacterium]MBT5798984.1 hypothetical protein [Alphaproteobacteria bacterium]